MSNLCKSLQRVGHHFIDVPPSSTAILEKSLACWQSKEQYRFPPPNETVDFDKWPSYHQQSYQEMLKLAASGFKQILNELDTNQVQLAIPSETIKDLLQKNLLAFRDGSFMNIFNYNYGKLGRHKDRGLITIIYRQHLKKNPKRISSKEELSKNKNKKVLWCTLPSQSSSIIDPRQWHNTDNSIYGIENKACLFVGEEMNTLTNGYLPHALHCVLNDPNVDYNTFCNNSNEVQSRDENYSLDNRLSIAMIFSSPVLSDLLEKMNSASNNINKKHNENQIDNNNQNQQKVII